jgi:bifunctional non-homologous end joining protein LigD
VKEVEPQLATLVDRVPTTGPWVYEIKYDGYRAIATLEDGNVTIVSRNRLDWTARFAKIAAALAKLRARSAVFDGEIAYVEEDGRTSFQHLQSSFGRDTGRVVYFIFDLLHRDGEDLRGEPLVARKEKLRALLAGARLPLKLGDHMTSDGEALFTHACKLGLEGIIAKRADRPYRSGRSTDWVKVKCQKRQELTIVGFTRPKGSRSGIGAVLVAVREGKTYRYVGKVGTGFTQASLTDLAKRLGKIARETPTVAGAPKMRDVTWVKPELVCEVRFTDWTRDRVLRHPSFEGLREDKTPAETTREKLGPRSP